MVKVRRSACIFNNFLVDFGSFFSMVNNLVPVVDQRALRKIINYFFVLWTVVVITLEECQPHIRTFQSIADLVDCRSDHLQLVHFIP